ncbi:signal peptidase I [Saccharicrinis carchari]|nr:signal peptidase I [Saccharicrinis carchari]
MDKKRIFKITLIVLFVALGIWSKSILPYLIVLIILDSLRKNTCYPRILNFVKKHVGTKMVFVEWVLAILLATWLIAFAKNNFADVYTFHTSSMHQTLQVGDVLLVNKLVPGPRHNCNNVNNYVRSCGTSDLTYNNVIIFNYPEADTLLESRPTESYHYLRRLYGEDGVGIKDKSQLKHLEVDQRPRFVKRVFGLPGDSIKIDYGRVFANDKHIQFPQESIDRYLLSDEAIAFLKENNIEPYNEYVTERGTIWELMQKDYERLQELSEGIKPDLMLKNLPDPLVFPFNSHLLWNMHHMGPVYIPKKGDTVSLTPGNLDLYSRAIQVFEQNQLIITDEKVWLNGEPATHYTFKLNYYWVMGDNRPHSFDSRFWGFVPENHIIGKVEKIIFSRDINKKGWIYHRKNRFLKELN